MKFKTVTAVVLILIMAFGITACGSAVANQNAVPHDLTAKILSELNITPESYASESGGVSEIVEYYSASEDYYLDTFAMMVVFPSNADNVAGENFADYSIINYDKTVKVPFELVIIKLPKTDGKTDADLLASTQAICQAKLDELVSWMNNYAPEQVNTAKKATVQTYDNYVYYCLAEKNSSAEEIIKSNLTASE